MLSYANFKLTPLIKWQNRTHPKSRILWRFSNLFYSVVVQKVKTCPKITFNVMILMFMFLKGSPNIMTVAGRARDWFYAQCLKIVQKVAFNFASGQTVLPDRSILIGQKLTENAKIQFTWDHFGQFQTLCEKGSGGRSSHDARSSRDRTYKKYILYCLYPLHLGSLLQLVYPNLDD